MLEDRGNKHADILLTCIEEKLIRDQIVFEHHSLVRVLSGTVKVIQADNSFTFYAGDTLFIPRNQLATFYKYSKDGKLERRDVVAGHVKPETQFLSQGNCRSVRN